MPEVKLDIYGSTYTKGVSTNRYDRAIRLGIVRGLTQNTSGAIGSDTAMQQAVDEILNHPNIGTFHHLDQTLPLARISAQRFGPQKVWVRLEYGRRVVNIPTQPAAVIARFRTGAHATRWYRLPFNAQGNLTYSANGQPNGPIKFLQNPYDDPTLIGPPFPPERNPKAVPDSWVWRRPAAKIYVPTVLNFNPFGTVSSRLDCINGDTINWGGHAFGKYRLRFDAVHVDWAEGANGVSLFLVEYEFTAVRGGFYTQHVFPPGTPTGLSSGPNGDDLSIEWFTKEGIEYFPIGFANAFPVHA